VVGAAPNASLGALRLLGPAGAPLSSVSVSNALRWDTTRPAGGGAGFDGSRIDIYNNSYKFGEAGVAGAFGETFQNAIIDGASQGRGGLGSIYVWSAANDRAQAGDVNNMPWRPWPTSARWRPTATPARRS
jgi:hypothetical protein